MIVGAKSAINLLLIASALVLICTSHYTHSHQQLKLQQQQQPGQQSQQAATSGQPSSQKQVSAAEAQALLALRRSPSPAKTSAAPTSSPSNPNEELQVASVPKSNHRLVNKLKDARHRRRNRHQRHRQRHYQKAAAAAAAVAASEVAATHASPTLTALESIVEEVARAGQLPVNNQQQQQQHVQISSQQITPANGPAILLEGSTSPISALQPTASQLPVTAQQQPVQVALAPQPLFRGGGPGSSAGGQNRGFLLTSMLSKIMNVLNVTEFALEMRDGISSRASCMACNAVVGLFLSPLYSKEVFSAAIRTVCTSFKIQSARVCTGLVESFQDDFEYIRKNTKLSRDEICAVVFGVDCARRQTYNLFWTVPVPSSPLPATGGSSGTRNVLVTAAGTTTSGVGVGSPQPAVAAGGEQIAGNGERGGLLTELPADEPPDLLKYRRSAQALVTSGQAKLESRAAALHNASQMGVAAAAKAAKALKRPQYIFGSASELDDQLGSEGSNRDLQTGSASRETTNKGGISSFVHITDIHIDPYYEAGSLNDCNEPLCCRATSGPVASTDRRHQAGKWGDYGNCDTPVRTLRSALNRIREQHSNAEYWLWTGDISPHDIWNISKVEAANHVRLVSKLVREYSNGVPVFPVIGNHEAHPVNSFSPPEIKGKFSMSWLYDLLADEWSDWLPMEAIKTLRVGGYYKLHVRRGFRIIALNTNYCARLNPWSFYDPVDPAKQLKWLVDELLEAELNQDKVHIIGHVPPDNRECTQAWLFNFINIVDRFKDTILAQFYGHTHRDEWRIIYSTKRQDEPIGIQFIGPSITPFTENNPAYRVYHQDKAGNLIDSETYYFNLTEANESPTSEPNWRFSYGAQAHLNMTQGLTPNEWHNYLQRLQDDEELFDTFYKNYYRFSDVKTNQVCKSKCKHQMLSDLRLSHPYKTKPKPFLANRKTSNHHRDSHHHKRLRHSSPD